VTFSNFPVTVFIGVDRTIVLTGETPEKKYGLLGK